MSGCTFYYNYGEKGFDSMAAVSLVPAIVCTIKVFFKPSIITVNKKGIWFGRSAVTDWPNFINAATQQLELKVGGFTDRNILYVQYLRPGTDEKYKKTIQLGNTQKQIGRRHYCCDTIFLWTFFYRVLVRLSNQIHATCCND